MKRILLLIAISMTCFSAMAQRQVLYLPTVNQVEILNAADVRWIYATSTGCNVQVGGSGTRIINSTLSFSAIKDSLGRNFGQVTQRYATGGTINSRPALVSLRHIRNILTKSGVTTIQINDPNQDYGVYETIAQLQDIVGYPIGDGSGVTGGGIITPDTLYIVNDGGGTNPDTIIIVLPEGADGNGIFGVPDTVPSGMVATIDSGITFQGLQATTFFNIDMDQGLYGTDYLQNDDTLKFRFYDLGSDSWLVVDAAGIEIHSDGPDKIVLDGATRITDLITDPATKLVGADNDGDLSSLVLGSNLSISNDTLNATGGSGATDLSFSGASSPVTLESSTGTDVNFVAGTGISLSATGTDITITNSNPTDDITGSGLANRLPVWFSSGYLGYESTFRVDSVNNRLMIGSQAAPAYNLDILSTDNIGLNLTSNNTLGTSFQFGNTSTGGKTWTISVGGQLGAAANLGDIYFYNQTDARFGSFTIDGGTGAADFWRSTSADVRFYTGGSTQVAKIRASDGLFGAPFFAAYNDVTFGLAQTTATNIKAGLNFGPSALLEWAASTNWFSAKDVGLNRASANTLNLSDGSTGYGNIRLNTIRGKGTTNATWSLRAANSLDSVVVYAPDNRRVGINTTTPDVSLDAGDNTDQIKIPAGTTAQRAAVNNSIRYNSDAEGFEARENGVWFRLTSSQAPSIAAGTAAGTGPTVAIGAGSNDLGGTIEITTGTSTTTGTLATITYGDAFDAALNPAVTITPANAKAAEHMLQWHKGTSGNTSFVLTSRVALDASTLYVFTYQVQQ